jgi:hypothetical protein
LNRVFAAYPESSHGLAEIKGQEAKTASCGDFFIESAPDTFPNDWLGSAERHQANNDGIGEAPADPVVCPELPRFTSERACDSPLINSNSAISGRGL